MDILLTAGNPIVPRPEAAKPASPNAANPSTVKTFEACYQKLADARNIVIQRLLADEAKRRQLANELNDKWRDFAVHFSQNKISLPESVEKKIDECSGVLLGIQHEIR